jgi:branched-chain amino acid transport system permease protein
MKVIRPAPYAPLLVIVAVGVGVPLVGGGAGMYNFTTVGLLATAVVGLNIMQGLCGQVNLAQTTFMSIGAYAFAILTVTHGVNPWLAVAAGVGAALLLAWLLSTVLFRMKAHYLAMATFALALGSAALLLAARGQTGGGDGIPGVPSLGLGAWTLSDPEHLYVTTWSLLFLSVLLFLLLRRSHIGRAWRSIADRQDVAASLGINVTAGKTLAFVICSGLGAVSGILYTQSLLYASPDFFNAHVVVNLFLMLFIGGLGYSVGPVVGAVVVVMLPIWLGELVSESAIVVTVLLLALLIATPRGLLSVRVPWIRPSRWIPRREVAKP